MKNLFWLVDLSVFYIWNIVQSVNRSKGIKRNLLASSFSLFQKTIKIIFFSLILLLPILIILIVVMIKIRYISLRETQLWYDTSVDGGPHCDQMGEEKLAQFPQKLPKKVFTTVFTSIVVLFKSPKQITKYLVAIVIKFVAKNFQKSPNLVALMFGVVVYSTRLLLLRRGTKVSLDLWKYIIP